jgi:secondary thiamine-phosphate synthase enzyme
MKVTCSTIKIRTHGEGDIVDLTLHVREVAKQSGILDGIVHLFVIGSTAAITTIEYEPGLVGDMGKTLERLIPKGAGYDHEMAWGDDNGHSHLRASLIGPSLTVPLVGGDLKLGTWQQIVLLEMDTRPRQREVLAQVLG